MKRWLTATEKLLLAPREADEKPKCWFQLAWRVGPTLNTQEVQDQDEAQDLYANLRSHVEIDSATLFYVVGLHFTVVEFFVS